MAPDLFATLSTELICMVLCHLDNPQDLYSVIRASPHVYKDAFIGSKQIILPSIVRNSFTHLALPDAIVAARFLPENQLSIYAHRHRQHPLAFLAKTMRERRGKQKISDPKPAFESNEVKANHVAALFGEHTPWEVEEIACVHQYITGRLEDVFEDVENYFVYTVVSTKHPRNSRYRPHGQNRSADLDSQEAEAPFCEPDVCMFMDSEKSYNHKIIEHIATFGFQFLRTFFEADNAQRTNLIRKNYNGRHSNLTDALECRPMPETSIFKMELEGRQTSQTLDFEGDEYDKRNLAWLWSNQYRPRGIYHQTCNLDLRAWGYVFWDKDRLDHLGILKKKRPLFYTPDYPPHYRKPEAKPSAQKRLRNFGLA